MNRYKLMILCWILYASSAYSQQDNIWYFGQNAGITFSNCSPAVLTDSNMLASEGCSVMSGPEGLLFYTNGEKVWNRNHEIMDNSEGIKGSISSTQTSVVPRPGMPGRYYLFTINIVSGPPPAGLPTPEGLYYSEIDMAAAGGLGSVINKNIPLINPVCEKLAATWHANETDIWITTHHWGSDAFYSYLITSAGVSAVPVISNTGSIVSGAPLSNRYSGYMKTSPDGSRLAVAHHSVSVQLFDFDTTTGRVSNPITLNTGGRGYGLEFSPSGNVLYVNIGSQVYQYWVNAPDVASSQIILPGIFSESQPLQLAPDSKIYLVSTILNRQLSVIENPEVIGTGCNFRPFLIDLAGRRPFFGLPSFLISKFYMTGITTSGICANASVSFQAEATVAPETVEWDFGDGATATGVTASHQYNSPGTYTVTVSAVRKGYKRCFSKVITVSMPAASTPQDLLQCEANNGQAVFNLRQQDLPILGVQSPLDYAVTYHVSLVEAQAGINSLPDNYTNAVNQQAIFARVTNNTTGCYAITSFKLIVRQKPVLVMDDVYTFCNGNTTTLTAPAGFDAYLWSTGATTQTIQAGPGQYTLTVFRNNNGILCDATAAVKVIKSGAPVIKKIEAYDWTDHNNSIHVIAEGNGNFEYSIDGVNYQQDPNFTALPPGVYTVHVRDANGCGEAEEEVALLMYPRYFTPNGDSFHETWRIKFGQYEPELVVYIFDRYGKLLTSFKGGSAGWDGKYNGRDLPSTDYWFVAVRQNGKEFKGHFSMLR
jgi:gliding motility-associated-like protein